MPAGVATLIHCAFDTAVQAQVGPEAWTRTLPAPPLSGNDSESGDTLNAHPGEVVGAAGCETE